MTYFLRHSPFAFAALFAASTSAIVSCGGATNSSPGTTGVGNTTGGGTSSLGGASSIGGASSMAGANSVAGGASSMGGASSVAGAPSMGGASAQGGAPGQGGHGGAAFALGADCTAFLLCCPTLPAGTQQSCESAAASYASGEAMNPASVSTYESACAAAVAGYEQAGFCGGVAGAGGSGGAFGGLGADCTAYLACCSTFPQTSQQACKDALAQYAAGEAMNPSSIQTYEEACASAVSTATQAGYCGAGVGGSGGATGGLGPDCIEYQGCCATYPQEAQQACKDAVASYAAAEAMNPSDVPQYEASCAMAVSASKQAGYCGAPGEGGAGGSPALGADCTAYKACCATFPDPSTKQACFDAAASYAAGEAMNPQSIPSYEDACSQAVTAYKQAGYCGAGAGGAGGSG